MSPASWQQLYEAGGQFPWAVMIVPFAFLLYRAIAGERPERALDPELAPFVSRWTTAFTLAALADPLATGPLADALESPRAARALAIAFVLLGDFRVYLLVMRLRTPAQTAARVALEAAALSAIAPVFAGLASLRAGPAQATWLAHELASLALAFALARFAAPNELTHPRRAAFARAVLGAMAAYYGLWAAADVLILCGVDAGWLVRFVPNQLYYGLFVPFVWRAFFAAPARG
ncbi:MAG TPA: hypothetical protein VFT98_00115 [Myxococcota bacterium]|nr:hypothetical protein [Myxococcota bacterium]